jgi:hypothetical protein
MDDFLTKMAEDFRWRHAAVTIYDEDGVERFRSPLTVEGDGSQWYLVATCPVSGNFRACYHTFFDGGGSPILTSEKRNYLLSAGSVPKWQIMID